MVEVKYGEGSETNKESQKLDWETILLLSKQQFTAEDLSKIEAAGSFQMWVGRSSAITKLKPTEKIVRDTQVLMQERNPDAALPELNEVVGGSHSLLNLNAIGLAERFVDGRSGGQGSGVEVINRKDLENSAIQFILQGIKRETVE